MNLILCQFLFSEYTTWDTFVGTWEINKEWRGEEAKIKKKQKGSDKWENKREMGSNTKIKRIREIEGWIWKSSSIFIDK